MAAPTLPADVAKLRQQLIADQAPSVRQRSTYFDPSRFAARHGRPYSSRRLSIATLDEMRSDALLRFAQMISLVPIFTGKWHIECANARKAAFLDKALRRIIGRLILQFFECVPAGQRVMMADGSLRAIEDVREGDYVLSSDGTRIVPDQVEAVWSTETKQILRIKLSDGRVMRVSPDHKIYRWSDWIRAGDVVIGDAVTVPRRVPYLGVDDWDVETQKDDAFLLALWLAEGNKGYNQGFSVCNVDPIVVQCARKIARRKGWDFHHDPKRGVMRMTGNTFYRRGPTPPNFLRAYGVIDMKTTDIGIPDQIMAAPTEVVSEFIGTYIACDGTVKRSGSSDGNGCQTIFFSASERMMRDMQALLTRLGVRSSISVSQNKRGHLDSWRASISTAEENKRLADAVYAYGKDAKLKRLSADAVAGLRSLRDGAVPPAIYDDLPSSVKAANAKVRINNRSWTDSRRALAVAEEVGDEALQEKLTSGLGWARVVEIAEDGEEPCYDLQTREHHSFFLESGLVHNSWNFGWVSLCKQFGLIDPHWDFVDKDAPGGPRLAKVWDQGGYPALVWEPFVPLPPRAVAPVWTPAGDFNGIALAKSGMLYGLPTVDVGPTDFVDIPPDVVAMFTPAEQDPNLQKIDVAHALWVTNERDSQWGRIWGRSRLAYAYEYWFLHAMTLGVLGRSIERKGDPTVVVSYPQGSSMVDGVETPNQTIALQIGEHARSGSVLAVPSEVWGEDMATANQASKWKIDYLKVEENFDKLRAVLDYLDTMKIRSMIVAELSFAEGSGGTSSRNVAAVVGERTSEAQIFTQAEWDGTINDYMLPQLADANLPELSDVPARKVTQSFGEGESALAADIIRAMANKDAGQLPINWVEMLERFQIDALEGAQLDDWMKRMAKEAEQATQPPPTPARPGGPGQAAAGVTDTGFYYDAPEHLTLEDDALLASLPNSRHYADRAVLAQTRLIRRLWKAHLAEVYEDFAKHLASGDVELAQADDAQSRAERVVGAWRYTGAGVNKLVKATAVALGKILSRAGALELSASRIKTDVWDASAQTVDEWGRTNVAALVRGVDATTRAQLATFLASELREGKNSDEIAVSLRTHFAQFPDWRADLIAREETRRFYNAGTLFAADMVGSAQVQALDAQGPGPTDAECAARNGRVFSVGEAWAESAREHVRGTLAWRIIPPGVQLSFTRGTHAEMGDTAARFDRQERRIYLVEGLDAATEGRYLEQAVDWLITTG